MPLEPTLHDYEGLLQTLSDDERQRAERFHFDVHRRRFVIGRGMLRCILSRYVGASPAELRFDYGPHGKPLLVGAGPHLQVSFNASGSNDLAVYGVTSDRDIGVDVEWKGPDRSCDKIVKRFFAAEEKRVYGELADSQRTAAFFQSWTRKEAYIKAIGDGLSRPLSSFELTMAPGESPRVVQDDQDPDASSRWTIRDLTPPNGYAGALVVAGGGWELHELEWDQR